MKRREFLGGLMSGAVVAASGTAFHPNKSWAEAGKAASSGAGTRSLAITKRVIEVNGKAANVFGLLQPDGAVGLTLDADGPLDVALSNQGGEETLIHWHGLAPPWDMDGVPDNPAAPLKANEARHYTFPVGSGGTHWMHAHTLQEQNLMAAPLIVRTAEDRQRDEQEVIILLHDFSFTPAEELLAKLKGSAGGHGMNHGAMMQGMASNMQGHMSGAAMPGMAAMDLNDIEYDAYLANDRTLDDPEVVTVESGGRIRLRIINGATATAFTIDTGALSGQLIAVDGQSVQPVSGNRFPISMGQRLDIRLELPKSAGAQPILALREGTDHRTGIILAPSGAKIARIASRGTEHGPIVGLDLEERIAAATPLPVRPADRRFELTLTGNMSGYDWRIEGGDGLDVREGERVEIAMRNMSMMSHPMHLHGHHFQVVDIGGKAIGGAVRDTVVVPPMGSVSVVFDANNPGRWPLHCHHLYHMASGMMSFVAYA
ncbi:multicopper oxidase domain-containing protein [Ensifer adhaerens]|uniref:multicopper oxidase family protein n=1 Tax=Ensifer adhaerens TaxID=106592 RepID=UPI001CBD6765|nr:multicopper oxidase domain-containing protein [Ensifer adhaerens]MBZ7926040.1 multicopper oxidase domain-containing protein [Ensifer adhaerens]UAX97679.1 multicopper oxidase domain-containing protein [Ensifer adhaerens]UAY05161.1 multicopper oxidase domain-containing protein [Ensifer adhaerens]UAY12381.1 multicopper oxidase domain-containing protein [Ensifer adhaerens]